MGALAPLAPPPTSSPMTVSLSQIRPRGTCFLTNTRRSETFASRLYFAPGGMAIRPRTGREPGRRRGPSGAVVVAKHDEDGMLRPVALWAQTGTLMESSKGLGPLSLGLFPLLLFLGERQVASLCARRGH